MKLFEHPDFTQPILQATEQFRDQGLRPAIIEKDYYVTEALRAIAASREGGIIFNGYKLVKHDSAVSEDSDLRKRPQIAKSFSHLFYSRGREATLLGTIILPGKI